MSNPKPNFGSQSFARSNRTLESTSPMYSESPDIDAAAWAVQGDTYVAVPETSRALPAGFYGCEMSHTGPFFRKLDVSTDDLIRLPDQTTDMLLKEFVTFWERIKKFSDHGLSAKRGLILWGPPGSGKTSAVQVMAAHMIEKLRGVVVLAGEPRLTAMLLAAIRKIEPHRPLIVVYEDIDALVERYGEPEFLAMLDGERQIDNVVNVATTNYPERLDRRFADRPGRFDRVQYVGMPGDSARKAYLERRAPELSEIEIARWVKASDGWSIAHLRELIVAHQVLGEDAETVIDRLNDMREPPSSEREPDGQKLGFLA